MGVGLGPPHDVERDGLMNVAPEAADLKIGVARIERVAEGRRGLRGTLKGEHALRPGFAGELVGFLARLGRPFGPTSVEWSSVGGFSLRTAGEQLATILLPNYPVAVGSSRQGH